MGYNLTSPTGIVEPCDLDDLRKWFEKELEHVPNRAERSVLAMVVDNLSTFVRWPARALLLWEGCDRIPEEGRRQRYFRYPAPLKTLARDSGVRLDTRPNGPAIAAFLLAEGERPARFGSSNAWSIHHLYSGKFPYRPDGTTTHAASPDCTSRRARG
jgi:hypothetical protein